MDAELLTTTITGIAGAAKATVEAISAILAKTKGNREAEKATREALTLGDDLLMRLLKLEEVALSLHAENAKLRADIRREEAGATEREKYKTQQVGGATVLVREDQPGTYYCTTCGAEDHFIPIQAHPLATTTRRFPSHRCPKCTTPYRLRG